VERSRNVVVAIDVSRSMLAEDVRPNRLERTKADVADLIDSLDGDRSALVAFRRTGVVVCPLTSDEGFLRSALEQISPESAPRGETDIGSAIRASLEALDPAADDHNAIIIISDGGDLRGEAIKSAELAKKRGIPIFTVGIGDPKTASEIPGEDRRSAQSFKGETVKVKLEEGALKAIAAASNGRYVPLATAGTAETTLGAISRRFLRQVAAKEQNEEAERAAERYQIFLLPGLALLIAGASLSKGRFRKMSRPECRSNEVPVKK
jgi:Ca-activated chloride channel family protein